VLRAASRKILVRLFLACAMLAVTGHSQTMTSQQTVGIVSAERTTTTAAEAYMQTELSQLGSRGDLIVRARQQTLEILQSENTCSAWFEEVEPDIVGVFRSLHYEVDANGEADIYSVRDQLGDLFFKHPWGAMSVEGGGKNSFIELNGNGPFFIHKSRVLPFEHRLANFWRNDELLPVMIGPYEGATPEAQVTIMLHELGHIVERLPRDDNSWNGRSSENTREVLRHCKKEIRQISRQEHYSSKLRDAHMPQS